MKKERAAKKRVSFSADRRENQGAGRLAERDIFANRNREAAIYLIEYNLYLLFCWNLGDHAESYLPVSKSRRKAPR